MKRGRKKSINSGYIMNMHKNGNYFYAYSLRPFQVDGKVVYRRCQWGRLDDNLKFLPGQAFIALPIEEREKFIFPEDWDLSELGQIAQSSKRLIPQTEGNLFQDQDTKSYTKSDAKSELQFESVTKSFSEKESSSGSSSGSQEELCSDEGEKRHFYVPVVPLLPTSNVHHISNIVKLCGVSWLVEIWSKKIGLTDDLLEALNGDVDMLKIHLSMVTYALSYNYTMDDIHTTQSYTMYPYPEVMSIEKLGELTRTIGDREFESFFKLWIKRNKQGPIGAFDSTLTEDFHTDANPLGMKGTVFRYGYDIDDALKSEFIILYSLSNGYPLCYLNYGEDNEDFPHFEDALTRFRLLGVEDFTLFTNRQDDGVHLQVDLLALEGQKLIMTSNTASSDVDRLINTIHLVDHLPENMQLYEPKDLFYTQVRTDIISGKKVGPDSKITLFYSPEKDMRDRMKIQRRIRNMNRNVESVTGQQNLVYKEDFSKANNLIDIQYSAPTMNYKFSGVESSSVNKELVKKLIKQCGFYALRSYNVDMAPLEIDDLIVFASEHKTDFGILKDLLNLQRPYNRANFPSLKKVIKSKRFALFLSLIIIASLKQAFEESHKLKENFRDVSEMIMEMLGIRGIYNGEKLVGCMPISERQKLIVKELQLDQYPYPEMEDVTGMLKKMINHD